MAQKSDIISYMMNFFSKHGDVEGYKTILIKIGLITPLQK